MMWNYGTGYGLGMGILWLVLLPVAGFLFGLGFWFAKEIFFRKKK